MMACAILSDPAATVNPYGPPVADFVPSDETITPFQTVNFVDLTTGVPTSWHWFINGALFSIAQNPSYFFSTTGYFTIALIATNAYGSSSHAHTIHVATP